MEHNRFENDKEIFQRA